MKRYGFLFEKICDKDNLRLAHKNARKGKSHYKEVKMVNANEEYYIDELHELLASGKFTTSEYRVFTKVDKGKEREIYSLPYYPDRIVQHAIMQIVEPIWKPTLIKSTYQSIKGRGIHKAKNDLVSDIREYGPTHYLQVDVKKFYPSISNQVAKDAISKKIKCKKTLELLYDIINSCDGVPIGNFISQYIGNLVLNGLDHKCKERLGLKMYYRYCDDIVICGYSELQLQQVLNEIMLELNAIGLHLKPNYKINTVDKNIDFVGYVMNYDRVLVRKSTAKKFKKATNTLSICSYYGWLKHCNCYNLWRSKLNES
jgi:retron-type reverse transcriptase